VDIVHFLHLEIHNVFGRSGINLCYILYKTLYILSYWLVYHLDCFFFVVESNCELRN
jgi:hypothetical protein